MHRCLGLAAYASASTALVKKFVNQKMVMTRAGLMHDDDWVLRLSSQLLNLLAESRRQTGCLHA